LYALCDVSQLPDLLDGMKSGFITETIILNALSMTMAQNEERTIKKQVTSGEFRKNVRTCVVAYYQLQLFSEQVKNYEQQSPSWHKNDCILLINKVSTMCSNPASMKMISFQFQMDSAFASLPNNNNNSVMFKFLGSSRVFAYPPLIKNIASFLTQIKEHRDKHITLELEKARRAKKLVEESLLEESNKVIVSTAQVKEVVEKQIVELKQQHQNQAVVLEALQASTTLPVAEKQKQIIEINAASAVVTASLLERQNELNESAAISNDAVITQKEIVAKIVEITEVLGNTTPILPLKPKSLKNQRRVKPKATQAVLDSVNRGIDIARFNKRVLIKCADAATELSVDKIEQNKLTNKYDFILADAPDTASSSVDRSVRGHDGYIKPDSMNLILASIPVLMKSNHHSVILCADYNQHTIKTTLLNAADTNATLGEIQVNPMVIVDKPTVIVDKPTVIVEKPISTQPLKEKNSVSLKSALRYMQLVHTLLDGKLGYHNYDPDIESFSPHSPHTNVISEYEMLPKNHLKFEGFTMDQFNIYMDWIKMRSDDNSSAKPVMQLEDGKYIIDWSAMPVPATDSTTTPEKNIRPEKHNIRQQELSADLMDLFLKRFVNMATDQPITILELFAGTCPLLNVVASFGAFLDHITVECWDSDPVALALGYNRAAITYATKCAADRITHCKPMTFLQLTNKYQFDPRRAFGLYVFNEYDAQYEESDYCGNCFKRFVGAQINATKDDWDLVDISDDERITNESLSYCGDRCFKQYKHNKSISEELSESTHQNLLHTGCEPSSDSFAPLNDKVDAAQALPFEQNHWDDLQFEDGLVSKKDYEAGDIICDVTGTIVPSSQAAVEGEIRISCDTCFAKSMDCSLIISPLCIASKIAIGNDPNVFIIQNHRVSSHKGRLMPNAILLVALKKIPSGITMVCAKAFNDIDYSQASTVKELESVVQSGAGPGASVLAQRTRAANMSVPSARSTSVSLFNRRKILNQKDVVESDSDIESEAYTSEDESKQKQVKQTRKKKSNKGKE
jgi:hypothetical protein